ncbi:MAG: VCBS repeat-containing protein [Acidobacteria bacterium]|nr:VCBS repeat-containing protein [Acidobacteriota bacterium]
MTRLKSLIIVFFVALALYGLRPGGASATAYLAVPRGVAATDGDHIDKVNVSWFSVRGANRYRIFRNVTNDAANASDVGNTAANYFFDASAVVGQTYFYGVRAENDLAISDLSAADQGVRADGSFNSSIFSALSPPPVPLNNPVTAAKASLGKTLFWDEQLSSTLTVACGTCHRPASGGSDPRTNARNPGFDNVFNTADDVFGSPGVPNNNPDGTYSASPLFGFAEQVTGRRAPSYLNAGITTNGSFWDGRATNTFRDPLTNAILINDWGGLENQVLGPPLSAVEMAHGNRNWTQAAEQIANSKPLALATGIPPSLLNWIDGRSYPELFEDAFGTPDVTPSRIALAIATHERTLFSDRTPLDRWASANGTLTAQEDRGRDVFVNVNCSFCHGGPVLADQNFHNVGVRPQNEDTGRFAVTGNTNDRGRFKTANLRNVELRGSYMHNGRFSTLEEVVEFYNRGGDFDATNINRGLVRPLNLTTQQKADLVAFLKRPLTDQRVRDESAPFDRPRLYTESGRAPVVEGTGRAGTGGLIPQVTAIEPPLAGNPGFTVGVSRAFGNSSAVLVIDSSDPGAGASIPATGSFARVTVTTSNDGFGSVSLPIANDPALVGRTFFGRWYVNDAGAANGFSVSQVFRFTVFAPASTASRRTNADFDGDGRTDLSIFRPAPGEWWISRSANGGNFAAQFGASSDKIVPADFTGDGRTDIAVWRPSTGEWFVLRSEDSTYYSFPFGVAVDIPVPADYDADGKADAAVFRTSNSNWFVNRSTGGTTAKQFGANGDLPLAGDFDGDGRADTAIYRPSLGEWWIDRSSNGVIAFQFGSSTDKPVPADYTGDGKTDAAVWRPSTGEWFVLRSEDSSYFSFAFGSSGDTPAPGDYDGDGRSDAAVFRPTNGTWYLNQSRAGISIRQFGLSTDRPVPSAYVP